MGAVAFPKASTCSGLPLYPSPTHLPLKDTREISAGPGPASAQGWALSLPGWGAGQGWEMSAPPSRRPNATDSTRMGQRKGPNGESQVKRPRAVRTVGKWGEAGRAPLRSRDTGWRLESLAVWSAGPCVHPPPRPALGFSWPLRLSPTGRGGRSSGQHGLPWPPERGL